MKTVVSMAVAAIVVALSAPALAESRTTEKFARVQSLPAIRLIEPPANGTVTVRKGTVTATNYKQCLALQVPAFVAIYRSRANFSGVDTLELEVKYESGRLEIQKFQITVGSSPASQPI
jgi:hypothetical protein